MKREPSIKQKTKACKERQLINKYNGKISLSKLSEKTKIRDSLYDILIG